MKHRVKIVWDPYVGRWHAFCYDCVYDSYWRFWVFGLADANEHFETNQEVPF